MSFKETIIQELIQEQIEDRDNYTHKGVIISPSKYIPSQNSLQATEFIPAHTIIFWFQNILSTQRTRTSIQVGKGFHIEAGSFGSYTNHSCTPNAAIISSYNIANNTGIVVLKSISDINIHDEITFDYATTESTVTSEILFKPCLCGTSECRKTLCGFNELTILEQNKIIQKGFVAPYLKNKS